MDDAPKSAYEIAMEKLKERDREKGEAAPAVLSEDQKQRIAEVRRKFEARMAEREIVFRGERAKAAADPEGAAKLDQVEKEYAADRSRLESQRDREIGAIRTSSRPSSAAPKSPSPAARGKRRH